MVTLPRLDELNKLSTSQNCLIMLRIMNTSDLTFHYMLYTFDTLRDICKQAEDLVEGEIKAYICALTVYEYNEYMGYIADMRQYMINMGALV